LSQAITVTRQVLRNAVFRASFLEVSEDNRRRHEASMEQRKDWQRRNWAGEENFTAAIPPRTPLLSRHERRNMARAFAARAWNERKT
jgi:hypothetical protein